MISGEPGFGVMGISDVMGSKIASGLSDGWGLSWGWDWDPGGRRNRVEEEELFRTPSRVVSPGQAIQFERNRAKATINVRRIYDLWLSILFTAPPSYSMERKELKKINRN
jgi:hypothetical protein